MAANDIKLERYVEREDHIQNLCRGKRVLHLGCVGWNDLASETKIKLAQQSLHSRLSRDGDCVGVDIDAQTLKELQSKGIFNNVLAGDVEHLEALPGDLDRFDMVVAGDIIEHLSNPGLMLAGARKWLRKDGRLIVSTPNAFGLPGYLRYATGKYREGKQHVLNFNPWTLKQLVERNGFTVESAVSGHQQLAHSRSALFPLASRFLSMFPRFGGTIIFVCKIKED